MSRPRWIELEDTPPSQDVQPSPTLCAPLSSQGDWRCSQASQESLDLDGTREALRAQLETAACLSSQSKDAAMDCEKTPPVRCLRRRPSATSMDTTAKISQGATSSTATGSSMSSQASPSQPWRGPFGADSAAASGSSAPTEASSGSFVLDSFRTPPRVPAHKRGHGKEAPISRTGSSPRTALSNKRPRNETPAANDDTPARGAQAKATPKRGTPKRRSAAKGTPKRQAAQPKAKPTEEDEKRRREHRHNAVVAIKRSHEYELMQRLKVQDCALCCPSTPDPDDLTVAKRPWERSVMDWRNSIKSIVRGGTGAEAEAIEEFSESSQPDLQS